MRKLQESEIDKYIEYIDFFYQYKNEVFSTWEDYKSEWGLFILKAEILALLTIYRDVGMEIPDRVLPSVNFDDVDYTSFDYTDDLSIIIHKLVFPHIDMRKKGWEEQDITDLCDYLDPDVSEEVETLLTSDDVKEQEAAYQKILDEEFFLDEGEKILDLKDFIINVASGYNPTLAVLIKSERVGKFLEYAEKNQEVKNSKLYNQVMLCVDRIISPFHCYFPLFEDRGLHNGCYYAFYTAGFFEYSDEYVGYVHCNFTRHLCIEILDQLLERAEKLYSYDKK